MYRVMFMISRKHVTTIFMYRIEHDILHTSGHPGQWHRTLDTNNVIGLNLRSITLLSHSSWASVDWHEINTLIEMDLKYQIACMRGVLRSSAFACWYTTARYCCDSMCHHVIFWYEGYCKRHSLVNTWCAASKSISEVLNVENPTNTLWATSGLESELSTWVEVVCNIVLHMYLTCLFLYRHYSSLCLLVYVDWLRPACKTGIVAHRWLNYSLGRGGRGNKALLHRQRNLRKMICIGYAQQMNSEHVIAQKTFKEANVVSLVRCTTV